MNKSQKPIKKVPRTKRTQPKLHKIKIIRTDGSFAYALSSENKDITCQIDFNQHSAYLPRKEAAKLIVTSPITEGLL